MKLQHDVKVRNHLGLHCRPASQVVKLLQNCKSKVSFTHKKDTINAKSIMNILALAAKKNAKITITVEGEDAPDFMFKLVTAFEDCFGEEI